MVSYGKVFESAVASAPRHLFDRGASVGVGRMRMEIAAQFASRQQRRQVSRRSRLDFTTVFAQFRRNPSKAKHLVDLLLSLAGEHVAAAEEAILIEQQAAHLGHPPQMNAVSLRAREIEEGGSVALFGHDAEVHLKTVAQHAACPRLTRAKRSRNVRKGKELAHHTFRRRSDNE